MGARWSHRGLCFQATSPALHIVVEPRWGCGLGAVVFAMWLPLLVLSFHPRTI